MPKNTIKYVIFIRNYGCDDEYLCELEPYHEYTKDVSKAKRFTMKGLNRVYVPLRNESVRYNGYSKYGFFRVYDKPKGG